MSNYTDQELLALFREENSRHRAFNLIIQGHQERVYWHVRKIVIDHEDANDVVQNTFVKAWKGLHNFREDSKIFTWLYRIATNESITFLKKKRAHLFSSIEDVQEVIANNLESDHYFDGDEIERKLQQALLSLPHKQRIVFNMKYFEEMKYQDISEVLDTSVGALKASYHHAVKKITTFLKNDLNLSDFE
ncbi:MAG TPA: RNA polymerase subunit sigma [Flavobacteriales bacterium]|nr:RNA polymerase subunit sigma [Flavobacteriales bacterium]